MPPTKPTEKKGDLGDLTGKPAVPPGAEVFKPRAGGVVAADRKPPAAPAMPGKRVEEPVPMPPDPPEPEDDDEDDDLVDEDPGDEPEEPPAPPVRATAGAEAKPAQTKAAAKALDRQLRREAWANRQAEAAARRTEAVAERVLGREPAGERKVDKEVQGLLPSTDKFRIYWRDDDGKLHLINDYTTKDIKLDGDINAFVNKTLRSTYGDKDFAVYQIKNGEEVYTATIPRRNPKVEAGETGSTISLLKTFMDELRKERETKKEEPGKASMFDEMSKIMQVLQSKQPIDPMIMMMMPMLRESIESMRSGGKADTSVMTVMSQVIDRLDRLETRDRERSNAPAPVTTLPPISAAPEGPSLAETLEKLVPMLRPEPKKDLFADQILPALIPMIPALMQTMSDGQRLRDQMAQERIAAQQQMFQQQMQMMQAQQTQQMEMMKFQMQVQQPKSIMQQMHEYQELQEMAKRVAGPREVGPPVSESFWDFAKDAWTSLPAVLSSAKDLVETQRGQAVQSRPSTGQPARQEPARPKRMQLEFPDGGDEIMAKIEASSDDKAIISEILGFMDMIGPLPSWERILKAFEGSVKTKNKEEFLRLLGKLLNGLENGQKLSSSAAKKVSLVFDRNINEVMDMLFKGMFGEAETTEEPASEDE